MTSKNLYWAKWKENIKRRGWTLVLCFVVLFLLLPVANIIELNGRRSNIEKAIQSGASAEELENLFAMMQEQFAGNVGFSTATTMVMALIAILFAVQGFSFLYNRQKMDLYMSVPVSSPKRFAMIWANGILMFVLCYLPNLVLTWGIGAALGVMDVPLLLGSVLAFFVNILAFTAMYQVALLAVMINGNVLTALLGCSVLFLYEVALRMLYGGLKSRFFVSYCSADQSRLDDFPWVTPFCGYMNFCSSLWYEGSSFGGYNGYSFGSYVEMTWGRALLWEVLLLLLASVIFGALMYLVFRKRKTESYHTSIAFEGMKGVLEFFRLVPFSLAAGLFICEMAENEGFFLFAGAIGGILIGHGVLQLIYERDLRALVKRRATLVLSLAASILALALFRYDLTGFDSYVPETEKIRSIAVSLESDYRNFGWYQLDESVTTLTTVNRLLGQMKSTEPETIEAVLQMVNTWQEAGMPTDASDYALSAETAIETGTVQTREETQAEEARAEETQTEEARAEETQTEEAQDEAAQEADAQKTPWEDSSWFVVRYDLTNGRTVYRRFLVDTSLEGDALNVVLNDASYREIRYQICTEAFREALDSMKIVYFDGKQELLYTTDKEQLYEAYLADFEHYDYELIESQLPCGILRFSMSGSNSYRGYDWAYPVYDSFANTIEVLAQNDIDAAGDGILSAEDVKEITVRYYVYDDYYEEGLGLFEAGEVSEQTIVCVFEDKEEISQILEGLYSSQLADVAGAEFLPLESEDYIGVTVSLTADALKMRYTADDLFFLKGSVPEFVKKKIVESAVYN